MRKATSHGDVGEVEGLMAVLFLTEAVRALACARRSTEDSP
jgi:hypothetical protein